MLRRRVPFGLLLSGGLVALVGILATLQYRWLGSVSDAERARLQVSLQQRAEDFSHELDRQFTSVYAAFQSAAEPLGSGDVAEFVRRYDQWRASGATALVRGVYWMTADRRLLEFERQSGTFAAVDFSAGPGGAIREGRIGETPSWSIASEPFDSSAPALVVPIPAQGPGVVGPPAIFEMRLTGDALVVWLDRRYLQAVLLPSLADRYFPVRTEDFHLAVVNASDPADVVFSRGLAPGVSIDGKRADAALPLVSLRPEVIALTAKTGSGQPPELPNPLVRVDPRERINVYVEQRTTASTGRVMATFRAPSRGGWTLVVQHASGSLDTLVAQGRRRNLLLSFGILALLGVSVSLIAINAQRSQRLATQQMDFVATVSHELRTPLTVIQSAAQNLSAGVITDPARARQYGELIDAEGRRLTDMVEQILEFAGLASGRPATRTAADAADVVRKVAASCATLAADAGLRLELDIRNERLVSADEQALRRAVTNLVGNGIKYAGAGGLVRISVREGTGAEVQISVSDRGPGIDPEDLPHLFEPFYRSRHAMDRQIHGNGLGLALVKRVVEAYGGRVTVESTPGQGATFILHLATATPV